MKADRIWLLCLFIGLQHSISAQVTNDADSTALLKALVLSPSDAEGWEGVGVEPDGDDVVGYDSNGRPVIVEKGYAQYVKSAYRGTWDGVSGLWLSFYQGNELVFVPRERVRQERRSRERRLVRDEFYKAAMRRERLTALVVFIMPLLLFIYTKRNRLASHASLLQGIDGTGQLLFRKVQAYEHRTVERYKAGLAGTVSSTGHVQLTQQYGKRLHLSPALLIKGKWKGIAPLEHLWFSFSLHDHIGKVSTATVEYVKCDRLAPGQSFTVSFKGAQHGPYMLDAIIAQPIDGNNFTWQVGRFIPRPSRWNDLLSPILPLIGFWIYLAKFTHEWWRHATFLEGIMIFLLGLLCILTFFRATSVVLATLMCLAALGTDWSIPAFLTAGFYMGFIWNRRVGLGDFLTGFGDTVT